MARETPLTLETVRAVAEGRLKLSGRGVLDNSDQPLPFGLDLTPEVENGI
jgi:hypothetical protein